MSYTVLYLAGAASRPPRRRSFTRVLRHLWQSWNGDLPAHALAAGPGRDL